MILYDYSQHMHGPFNKNSVQIALELYTMMNRSFECAGQDPRNVNFDPEFPVIANAVQQNNSEEDLYFYHTDHLGSSSWITFTDGSVTQHLQNLPFGEPFIDQRATSYDVRFKFTGKEMDSETGYQYFGARYYDSDLSVWLSVDPLSDFRQGISPFNYVQWNPINRIDPSGMIDFKKRPGKKGKKPKRRRFRLRNRDMGTGQKLRWRNNKGNDSPPISKVNKIGRFFGLGRRIATVPMGRYRTSGWTPVGQGGQGITNFNFNPPNLATYRLRGFRIIGPGGGFIMTGVRTGSNGRYFGFQAALHGFIGNGMYPGFIPFINQIFAATFPLGGFPYLFNGIRINPRHRKATSWTVNRRGVSNNLNYNVQIRFRFWQQYGQGNPRPFWHRWFYF